MSEEKRDEEEFSTIGIRKSTHLRFYITKKKIEDKINNGQRIDNDKALMVLLDLADEWLKKEETK